MFLPKMGVCIQQICWRNMWLKWIKMTRQSSNCSSPVGTNRTLTNSCEDHVDMTAPSPRSKDGPQTMTGRSGSEVGCLFIKWRVAHLRLGWQLCFFLVVIFLMSKFPTIIHLKSPWTSLKDHHIEWPWYPYAEPPLAPRIHAKVRQFSGVLGAAGTPEPGPSPSKRSAVGAWWSAGMPFRFGYIHR